MSVFARTTLALAATAVLLASCLEDGAGPGVPLTGSFAIQPTFASAVAGIVPLSAARLTLAREGESSLVLDTVIPIAPGDTAVDLSQTVAMLSASDQFLLNVYLITPAGDTAFHGGPTVVTPTTSSGSVSIVEVGFEYVGIGSNAAGVRILTPDTAAYTGESVLFVAEAFDGSSTAIPGTPIAWASLDPARVTVPNDTLGTVVAGSERGAARITATLLTGPADTAIVDVQPVATQVVVVSGGSQSAEIGAALPVPVVLEVRAADGLPVTGVSVRLSVVEGAVSPDSIGVDANGRVSFAWTLGLTAGTQTVTATVVEFPTAQGSVTATATPRTAASLLVFAGDDQTGTVNTVLTDSLVVLALDVNANPAPGAVITWTVTQNDGTVSPLTSTTDVNGLAATAWTLGSLAGANEVMATIATDTVVFVAGGVAGPAAVLELVSGDAQSDTTGATLPLPLVVRVTDLFGNPVAGTTVDFATVDGGALVPASTTSDASGLAQSVWTLGPPAGAQSATATSGGLAGSPVMFAATATSTVAGPGVNIWTATSGTWSTDADWSLGRAPIPGDTVQLTQGVDYMVTLDVSPTIAKLAIGGTTDVISLNVGDQTLTITDAGVDPGLDILPLGNIQIGNGSISVNRLVNNGTVWITGNALLTASAISNYATWQVASGQLTVTHPTSYDFQQVTGSLDVASGAVLALGANGALSYFGGGIGGSASGTFGTVLLTPDVGLILGADLTYDSLTIRIEDGFTQRLASERLTVGANATLIFNSSAGGLLNTIVENQGTMVVLGEQNFANDSLYNAPGGQLLLDGTAGSVGLTVAWGLDNAGGIQFVNTAAGMPAYLIVFPGDLTNRADGTIFSLPGDGTGLHTIDAQLINDGIITLQHDFRLTRADAQHVNTGYIGITGGTFEIVQAGTNPTFTNDGIFYVTGGDVLVTQDATNPRVISSASLAVDVNRTMTFGGTSTSGTADLTAGVLGVSGTLIVPDSLFARAGAVIQGYGIIDVTNFVGGEMSADVLPGAVNQAGTLTFVGDMVQSAASTFYLELGGTGTGQSDLIEVTGTATLDGTVDVSTILPTYTPAAGDTIPILVGGQGAGEPVIVLPADPPGLTVSTYSVDAVAPTPDTVYVVFSGIAQPGIIGWTGGAGDGLWSSAGNWDLNREPIPNDTVLISLDGALVLLDVDAQVYALRVTGIGAGLLQSAFTFTIDSSLVVWPNALYDLSGGTLTGDGTVSIEGDLGWSGGTMSGLGLTQIESGGTLAMSGTAAKVINTRTLSNAGSATWDGSGGILGSNDAAIVNEVGATFDVSATGAFSLVTGNATFSNLGTLTRTTANTLSTGFSGTFMNSGHVDVQGAGAFSFTGTSGWSGIATVAVAAGIIFNSGLHTWNDGFTATGPISIAGGTVTVPTAATATVEGLFLSSGLVTGDGTVSVTGTLSWTGGTMSGTGTTIIEGSASISGAGAKTLDTRAIVTFGTVQYTGTGNLSAANGAAITIEEASLWNHQTDADLTGIGSITNNGRFRKSVQTGITLVELDLTNNSIVDIQTGTVQIGNFGSLEAAGTLTGRGNLDVTASGGGGNLAGIIDPGDQSLGSAGIFTWTGTFDPDPGATLNIDLGGAQVGTEHDLFHVAGSVQHDGTLRVVLRNGFTPSAGSRFPVMAFNDAVFGFATLQLPTVSGIVFDTLTVVNVDPVLDTLYVTASGVSLPIVFAGDSAGGLGSGVFTVNPDGTNRTNVASFFATAQHHPRWSPDRSRITYTYASNGAGTEREIWIMSDDGAESARIMSDTSGWRARHSPDGTHLAFECGDGGYPFSDQDVCVVVDVTGAINTLTGVGNFGQRVTVTDAVDPFFGGSGAFAWNPLNSNQLAVVRDDQVSVGGPFASQIWLVNYDGSGATALTPLIQINTDQPVRIYSMDWAPDGSFIAFEGLNQSTAERAIFRVELSDGTVTQLTSPGNGFPSDYRPVVSPNSSEILFAREVDGWVLVKVPSAGAAEPLPWMTHVFNFSIDQGGWDWSPDGTEIVHTTSSFPGGGVSIGKIKATTTQATYSADLVLVGRDAPLGAVQDRQPSWRP